MRMPGTDSVLVLSMFCVRLSICTSESWLGPRASAIVLKCTGYSALQ